MNTIAEIRTKVTQDKLRTIAIAGVTYEELSIVSQVIKENLAKFILVGDQAEIKRFIESDFPDLSNIPVYHADSAGQAPQLVMDLIREQAAEIPMKGQVHTGTFVKAILKPENGFFDHGRLSQITMFDGYNDDLQFLTDCAVNIELTLEVKLDLIKNAVRSAQLFGKREPKVALLGAVEIVNPKMQDTMDSAILTQMNRRGQIGGCVVDGPLSLDNAISQLFAAIKDIDSPVAGKADILVASSLNEANTLSKSIIHYAKKDACSIIAGTKRPVIMTSRTDTQQNKINTIATACYMLEQQSKKGTL
ncbi:phosphate acyltransferase [Oscillospiraceae bacterium MB08-C2-2]|nr:phosphate acyltransferase [Oscillospiraceae bacterium MB08-C2-2]